MEEDDVQLHDKFAIHAIDVDENEVGWSDVDADGAWSTWFHAQKKIQPNFTLMCILHEIRAVDPYKSLVYSVFPTCST